MSDQLVAQADTCTTHNRHKTNIDAVSGIKTGDPSNRAAPRPHALDRAITGLGTILFKISTCMLLLIFVLSEICMLCSVGFRYVW